MKVASSHGNRTAVLYNPTATFVYSYFTSNANMVWSASAITVSSANLEMYSDFQYDHLPILVTGNKTFRVQTGTLDDQFLPRTAINVAHNGGSISFAMVTDSSPLNYLYAFQANNTLMANVPDQNATSCESPTLSRLGQHIASAFDGTFYSVVVNRGRGTVLEYYRQSISASLVDFVQAITLFDAASASTGPSQPIDSNFLAAIGPSTLLLSASSMLSPEGKSLYLVSVDSSGEFTNRRKVTGGVFSCEPFLPAPELFHVSSDSAYAILAIPVSADSLELRLLNVASATLSFPLKSSGVNLYLTILGDKNTALSRYEHQVPAVFGAGSFSLVARSAEFSGGFGVFQFSFSSNAALGATDLGNFIRRWSWAASLGPSSIPRINFLTNSSGTLSICTAEIIAPSPDCQVRSELPWSTSRSFAANAHFTHPSPPRRQPAVSVYIDSQQHSHLGAETIVLQH